MIRELINFTNDLVASLPEVLQWNNKPSKGLHIFIELDENGNWKNRELQLGSDYIFFDGSEDEMNKNILNECFRFQSASDYITMNKVQRFDPKQKIHSCSPFSVAFNFTLNPEDKSTNNIIAKPYKEQKEENDTLIKVVKIAIVKERLNDYWKNSAKIYFKNNEQYEANISKGFIGLVKDEILSVISNLYGFSLLGEKDYIRVYLRTYPIEKQENYYSIYLKENIFNKEEFSSESGGVKYGVAGFLTTFADGKKFLKHQTAIFKKGVNQRLTEDNALTIEKFRNLFARKPSIFPNPLPLFIDKNEFKTNTEIIEIFNRDGGKLSYSQILKKIFDVNENRILANYYLLNMIQTRDGIVVNDFDFVTLFRYKIENCKIANLFNLKGIKAFELHSIFGFESIVIKVIFNNSLVKTEPEFNVSYFGKIEDKYISGYGKSEKHSGSRKVIYNLIMKYRQAIYDYIYKSKLNAITYHMFDDMMMNSIMADIKADEYDKFHTKDTSIKEKLNIWFSLYNFFALNENQKRNNMAETLKEHRIMMQELIEGKRDVQIEEEFAFVAGQVIYYLLSKSETTDKSYARLEPFLQKSDCGEFKKAVVRIFDMYKHKNFSQKFSKGMAQVMAFNTDRNLKEFTPGILAGFFSDNLLFSDMNKQNDNE